VSEVNIASLLIVLGSAITIIILWSLAKWLVVKSAYSDLLPILVIPFWAALFLIGYHLLPGLGIRDLVVFQPRGRAFEPFMVSELLGGLFFLSGAIAMVWRLMALNMRRATG